MLWKNDGDWVKRSMLRKVDGVRYRGQPKMAWNRLIDKDMKGCGLNKVDVQDQVKN